MYPSHVALRWYLALVLAAVPNLAGHAQEATQEYKPTVGQPGKDVVWVPTSPELVEKMLDLAEVTPQDFVVDLGSGDGRNVIAAARRGARALGVEYNPDMVELSRRLAKTAGVADRATFVQGDMYEADFSKATVLALFLLPDNMLRLRPKFLDLKPGTRIVANTFGIEGWTEDAKVQLDDETTSWHTALLWIVPAKVGGRWRLSDGELALQQEYQKVSGTLSGPEGGSAGRAVAVDDGRLRGDRITFRVGDAAYTGQVSGDTMQGTVVADGRERKWSATRVRP